MWRASWTSGAGRRPETPLSTMAGDASRTVARRARLTTWPSCSSPASKRRRIRSATPRRLSRASGAAGPLRAQPQLGWRATEEGLRYDPPIQEWPAPSARRLWIGERRSRRTNPRAAGRQCQPRRRGVRRTGSVRRGRHPNPQISFGGGLHYCLGAALARLELSAVLRGLLERTVEVEARSAGTRRRDSRFRCYASLPLTVHPA